MDVDDQKFEELVEKAWKKLPKKFRDEMENICIRIEEQPTIEQLKRAEVHGTLFGLFEGLPKTTWGQANFGIQPSKITLFKIPILESAHNLKSLQNLIQEVLMHEIGHYFGHNDEQMAVLDRKLRRKLSKDHRNE
jgi:predicted Zn-dependent protease with MMP-like domain